MKRYFKVSCVGNEMKAIAANSMYEAIGYYLLNNKCTDYVGEVDIEEIPADHKIEVSCIGFPMYKTVEHLHAEKNWNSPSVICELVE